MTARELARQLELPYTTVAGWLQKGQVPGAVAQTVGSFKVWMIPKAVLQNVDEWRPKPGRPKKESGEEDGQHEVSKKKASRSGSKKKAEKRVRKVTKSSKKGGRSK